MAEWVDGMRRWVNGCIDGWVDGKLEEWMGIDSFLPFFLLKKHLKVRVFKSLSRSGQWVGKQIQLFQVDCTFIPTLLHLELTGPNNSSPSRNSNWPTTTSTPSATWVMTNNLGYVTLRPLTVWISCMDGWMDGDRLVIGWMGEWMGDYLVGI